jgi:hypothetical protein
VVAVAQAKLNTTQVVPFQEKYTMQVGSRVFLHCIVYFKVERQSNLTDRQRLVPNPSSLKTTACTDSGNAMRHDELFWCS